MNTHPTLTQVGGWGLWPMIVLGVGFFIVVVVAYVCVCCCCCICVFVVVVACFFWGVVVVAGVCFIVATIYPCRQIRWIPPNLATCCHLCYASSVRPLESPF